MDKKCFENLGGLEDLIKGLKNSSDSKLQICGTIDTGRAHMMSVIGDGFKNKIITTFDEQKARQLYEDLSFYQDNVYYYPAKDFIFFSADMQSGVLLKDRLKAQRAVAMGQPITIVTTIDGLMDKLPDLGQIKSRYVNVTAGSTIELEALKLLLVNYGYERKEQVDMPGQFSVRGSIVDIFPMTEDLPYRIDLWDDEIDSIRTFDKDSQRAIENVEELVIYPATEYVLSKEQLAAGKDKLLKDCEGYAGKLEKDFKTEEAHRIRRATKEMLEELDILWTAIPMEGYVKYFYDKTVSFLDYFDPKDTICYIDETPRLMERMEAVLGEYNESMTHKLEKGYVLPGQTDIIFAPKEIYGRLEKYRNVHFTTLDQRIKGFEIKESYHFSMQNINSYNSSFEVLIKDLQRYCRNKYLINIVSSSRTRAERLADSLRMDYELPAVYTEDRARSLVPGEIQLTYGNIHYGYEYADAKLVVIAETDIFGKEKKRKRVKYSGQKIGNFADLNVGDYVVHENYGLGIYRGLEKIEVDKVIKDYIKIEYAAGSNLFILASRFNMLQKYAGSDAKTPKLNKLGTKEWSNTKTRVKKAVRDIADQLVELYAKRQASAGFKCGPDTVWQKEFEEMFPYEETEDQLVAIEDTKKDMESNKIMDRLICGDVGFGKTEVAIRAAFKAVQEGMQVAYLVPTTILAQQHYNTFVQRMKDYPVQIDMMSRFRTKAQQAKTIEGLKNGFVDIVIGTHRLLSKDVGFKKLGLLIIDEEQRFGVSDKEKIKQLKADIDVLTLTATPIPRTLHMSLVGIRDMSVLEEPPIDRMPIQTYVMEFNDEVVRDAINRELARGGQVYYVYNKVQNIEEVAANVAKLVPDAVVTYAHGQMSERNLEQIMCDFINGDIDVLVSTTIVETGLDISNANTMIIHDSDKMGLSQLYQLRGRIGRSNRTAYAFLMYRRDKLLKEIAEKRLAAIREFTELGSGFKIAMRDLELRGAGNVLGAEQHGHMEAVGYDLYCKMLNEAVNIAKGQKEQIDFETVVDLKVDAYIPPAYIGNEIMKLNMYRKIAAIESEADYDDMVDEVLDRFGEPPKAVSNLLKVALLKARAHQVYISEITGTKECVKITLYPQAPINVEKWPYFLANHKNYMKFSTEDKPVITYRPESRPKNFDELTLALKELIDEMEDYCEK